MFGKFVLMTVYFSKNKTSYENDKRKYTQQNWR